MFYKWKQILTNWVNCYFNESNKNVQSVSLESLLNIISHLRENLNLDESKSSVLEAHTVDEFISEKYPEFKFENGTVQVTNEDELYVVASLLLFFVCVSSKDVNLKNAMCSTLNGEDQKVILKFSKALMMSSPITLRDVQAAITEACGQEIAVMDGSSCSKVAETPPALRSLHSEVRRLQAALDAERFDRNYLQEELSRTNMRMEKLLKDKEQFKLDIVNLKARISLSGQEPEIHVSDDANSLDKLTRQLQEMEERLVEAQCQLDNVVYERDTCKSKLEDLKQDRDKWFSLSQQESARVTQLGEELDTEKSHVNSLRELVAELRQHNKLNRLDSSMLECDDPDASIQSLQHNLSVCSEVCANVVEVQLGEERAKIVVLKQNIQILQEQINELNQKAENDKQTYETILSEKDNDIFNLKHRINEEIEDKNKLKVYFNDEVSKLNNEINELEQILKDNNENSRLAIEKKMQEIQILQEEKLSLLQSLSDESTKLETLIKQLKTDIDSEKLSKRTMKDSYENQIMKLNEKVLNRNNELVELQNNVLEKSELIESLHLDLRREKELKEELSNKYYNDMSQLDELKNTLENKLSHKYEESNDLQTKLANQSKLIEELNYNIDELQMTLSELNQNRRILEETKIKLIADKELCDRKLEESNKQIENQKTLFRDEKEKLLYSLDEKKANVNSLQMQLQNEIQYKVLLQDELTQLQNTNAKLTEECNNQSAELTKLNKVINDSDKKINSMDMYLQDEKKKHEKLKLEYDGKLKEKSEIIQAKEKSIKLLKEKRHKNEELIKSTNIKLRKEKEEKETLESNIISLKNEIEIIEKIKNDIFKENTLLRAQVETLTQDAEQHSKNMVAIEQKLQEGILRYGQLENNFDMETSKMIIKLNETEKKIIELSSSSNKTIKSQELKILTLNIEIENLKKAIDSDKANVLYINKEKEALLHKLNEEVSYKNEVEREYRNQCTTLENIKAQYNSEIINKNKIIEELEKELGSALKTVSENKEGMKILEAKHSEDSQASKKLNHMKKTEIKALKKKINETETVNNELKQELKKETESKMQAISALQKENEQLHFTIEEDNSHHEVLIKEKDSIIDRLEQQLKEKAEQLESIRKDYEDITLTSEKFKVQMQEIVQLKEEQIKKLNTQITSLEQNILDAIETEKVMQVQHCKNLEASNNELFDERRILMEQLSEEKSVRKLIEEENHVLLIEKKAIEQQLQIEEAEKKSALEDKVCLTKQLVEEKSTRENNYVQMQKNLQMRYDEIDKLNTQIMSLEEFNMALQEAKAHEERQNARSVQDRFSLENELANEKAARDTLDIEKGKLAQELNNLIENNNEVLNENVIMRQQLSEERSIRKLVEEEKHVLLIEKKAMEQQLFEEEAEKNTVLEDKECLTQQLVEEKSAREISEIEKENLLTENQELNRKLSEEKLYEETLCKEIRDLVQDKELLKTNIQMIEGEKTQLIKDLAETRSDKDTFMKEKESLIVANETLKHDIIESNSLKNILVSDKELLMVEKQAIAMSLDKEKAARDVIETEKKKLKDNINELKKQFSSEMIAKQNEMENVKVEFKLLKTNFEEHEEISRNMSIVLCDGMNKLLQKLQNENITNEVLQKLTTMTENKDMSATDKCDLLLNIADALTTELTVRKNLEKVLKHENTALSEMRKIYEQKEIQVLNLQTEIKRLQQVISENKIELSKRTETYNKSLESKARDIHTLQHENQSLHNDLNDVKLQLEVKVHSLKEKLVDNEHLTDKLKGTYECQIDNLNMMITKLSNYLKDKSVELDALRKEKEKLQQVIEENNKAIKSLEDEVKSEMQKQEKLIEDFESERLVLKNMVTVTESVMDDQKISFNKAVSEHLKANEVLEEENKVLKELIESEKGKLVVKLQEKETALESIFKELAEVRNVKGELEEKLNIDKDNFSTEISSLKEELKSKDSVIATLKTDKNCLSEVISKYEKDIHKLEESNNELKIEKDSLEVELECKVVKLTNELDDHKQINERLQASLDEKNLNICDMQSKLESLQEEISQLTEEKNKIELQKNEYVSNFQAITTKFESQVLKESNELKKLKTDNAHLISIIEGNKTVIKNLELLVEHELQKNQQLRESDGHEKQNLISKCSILQEYQSKAEKVLEDRQKDINTLKEEVKTVQEKVVRYEQQIKNKEDLLAEVTKEKDAIISNINKELLEEKSVKEKYKNELESAYELKKNLDEINKEQLKHLRIENEEMLKVIGQRDTFAVLNQEKTSSHKYSSDSEKELRNPQQVDNISSDITHSSMESLKTISDLEKIINDKNRMITTLQSDVTYMKTLMAESENKLLDVTKELEVSKENCLQLSNQLKKIVYMKNEEIAELKKQLTKMSVTENRASQIIKVSAKYQTIILKRIAEIKSNTVLKELTNFGNSNNCDNELRRGLNAGTITIEDLENFLETTDKHLKRCSDKQLALQKERDRLTEVNRINESEIINLKKFLTELSVSFQTFSSVKDMYAQKLSRVVSIQRTVRREILSLDGQITDATMCKLERGYAAVIQDLSECAMNLERWVERCIGRAISPEKIKQAFTSDDERTSLAPTSFQNAGLEVQLGELENSFQKLLEEVVRAQKGEGAKDAQAVTVMEVRAEYEDKLNRMKAKMKQLYLEQIAVCTEKERMEISSLKRELQNSREKAAASSLKYEEHIRALTQELWSVGEKFLMKKDEAEWLRRKQRSGSLMSLQHVHSSGLVPTQEEPSRPSDSHSLRSLPMANNNTNKREGRGLHMSDEEGEVFDNRCLKDLATPKRDIPQPHHGMRLSELRYRNSLCLPHLKSSYPAETQFAAAVDEEDIKCIAANSKPQRKEVGIIAYKKPGPPTPSKQAGRLSATDSELRESLRVEAEPQPGRKTSTPSRIRSLFRSAKNDTVEGTPRSRRLSSIFRKK